MTVAVRVALGLALGALLASLPFLHFGTAGGHVPAAVHVMGGSHATHTH